MSTLLSEFSARAQPSEDDAQLAKESSRQIEKVLAARRKTPAQLQIQTEEGVSETITIPASALGLLKDILHEMAHGNAVTLIPIHAELTTQQAADLLNVSRPFVVEQLEKGLIPFRRVGRHRRIRFQDILKYKQDTDHKRLKTLEELSALDQEYGLV